MCVSGRSPPLAVPAAPPARAASPAPREERDCLFAESDERVTTAVFDASSLPVGASLAGPAIVEEESTTIVVFPGSTLDLTRPDVYVMTVS